MQEKPEARKMLENAADSHTSGARFVRRVLVYTAIVLSKDSATISGLFCFISFILEFAFVVWFFQRP
jgi:hypothetical protein